MVPNLFTKIRTNIVTLYTTSFILYLGISKCSIYRIIFNLDFNQIKRSIGFELYIFHFWCLGIALLKVPSYYTYYDFKAHIIDYFSIQIM